MIEQWSREERDKFYALMNDEYSYLTKAFAIFNIQTGIAGKSVSAPSRKKSVCPPKSYSERR